MPKRKATAKAAVTELPATVTEAVVESVEAVTEVEATPEAVVESVEAVTEVEATPEVATEAAIAASQVVISPRARDYLHLLLSQYFGTQVTDESLPGWVEAINAGKQLLVRNNPIRGEITSVDFVAANTSSDVVGDDVLLNVQRQLVNVHLL